MDTSIVLTGILPTLRKYHLEMDNLTPKEIFCLMDMLKETADGATYELRILGLMSFW